VIARVWYGRAAAADAQVYESHFRDDVLRELARVDGFRGATLLRREIDDVVEFVTITQFASLDAVQGFAGDDYERARIAPAARALLVDFDERAAHYELA
jgi:heme-degrading monooxygenase HmoA